MTSQYVVTAEVWDNGRDWVSKPLNRSDAIKFANKLTQDMKKSIPKYKWATKIKVERVDI